MFLFIYFLLININKLINKIETIKKICNLIEEFIISDIINLRNKKIKWIYENLESIEKIFKEEIGISKMANDQNCINENKVKKVLKIKKFDENILDANPEELKKILEDKNIKDDFKKILK